MTTGSIAAIVFGKAKDPAQAQPATRRFNLTRVNLSSTALNRELNALIEASAPPRENYRHYLGASGIGSECLRKSQFDWMCDFPEHPVRTQGIFSRGHHFEQRMRAHLIDAGFQFAPKEQLGFSQLGGLFRGHADGVIVAGPLPTLLYPCPWECKCVKAQSWRAIEREGLKGIHEIYLDQVALYQAYLRMTNPCLFTVVNADTCERLFFPVPFDPHRAQIQSDRAFNIIEATRAGELLPRGFDSPDDWRCKMCPWREKCWGLS